MNSDSDIISKLKFIGRLKQAEYMNTKKIYIQPKGFYTSINRTFIDIDDRNNAYNFIVDVVTKSFLIIKKCCTGNTIPDKKKLINTINDIKKCREGIQNFKSNYTNDRNFISKIDTLLEDIDTRLEEYLEVYNEYYSKIETKFE